MSSEQVRGTQSGISQLGWVMRRPLLIALEVSWRWLFGVPLLFVCWTQAQQILAALPPETTGITGLSIANPWVSSVKLAAAWDMYRPPVFAVLVWLAPAAALAWIVLSAIGRNLVLRRMEPRAPFRPVAMMAVQAAWLGLLALTCWAWYASISWAAATHIGNGAEPDLIGYTIWVIFLSLGFFTLWGIINWSVAIVPMLLLLEDRSVAAALRDSLRLGRPFSSKLVEINLVMSIVKVALIVLAMVFSSVLIPFADELGMGALRVEWLIVSAAYFLASDYFHVVRLKIFVEFWYKFRAGHARSFT